MTMEALQSDFKDIQAKAKQLGPHTPLGDLVRFLKSDLVPFIESHINETAEIDVVVADMVEQADDVLQPETAAVFAGVIVGGRTMAAKLAEVLPKGPDGKPLDAALAAQIEAFLPLATEAEELLEEITIQTEDDDVDPDEKTETASQGAAS
jgi:hypothetical protein